MLYISSVKIKTSVLENNFHLKVFQAGHKLIKQVVTLVCELLLLVTSQLKRAQPCVGFKLNEVSCCYMSNHQKEG